jgi:hypothetical protein
MATIGESTNPSIRAFSRSVNGWEHFRWSEAADEPESDGARTVPVRSVCFRRPQGIGIDPDRSEVPGEETAQGFQSRSSKPHSLAIPTRCDRELIAVRTCRWAMPPGYAWAIHAPLSKPGQSTVYPSDMAGAPPAKD